MFIRLNWTCATIHVSRYNAVMSVIVVQLCGSRIFSFRHGVVEVIILVQLYCSCAVVILGGSFFSCFVAASATHDHDNDHDDDGDQ